MCKHPPRFLFAIIMKIKQSRLKFFFVVSVLAAGGAGSAIAQGLTTLETPNLRLLYFDPVQTYLAPHVARCFHNSLRGNQDLLGYEPDDVTTIFLRDFSDYGNAGASAVPNNILIFDVSPLSFAFETTTTSERVCAVMSHELVHVATMDQATAADVRSRRFFGGKVRPVASHPETIFYSYLTNPRRAAPSWYLEGIAVFMETWMAGGYGRAQGAYDEMVFRSMVRDDAYFYDPLGLEAEGSKIDFQVGVNNYLYGARFMSYLAYTYSPEKLLAWITRREGSEGHYIAHFQQVFGMPMEEAWQDWVEFEREFQANNLEVVRQFPITPYRDISSQGLGSVSRSYFDPETRMVYLGLRYPGVVAHIGRMSIDDGELVKLADIKGPMLYKVTSLALDPESKTLFFATDNYAYRDLMSIDVETGQERMLLRDARIGELVFNKADRSLWGIRHLNGIATLVRIPYPYTEWNQIHSLPFGQVFYDMDISPDGQLLSTSFGEVNGNQSLRVFNVESLLAGELTPLRRFDFGQAVPEGFVFSPDGNFLFGSSYYTGISNIFRYELASEELEAVSNAETGFFRPVPLDDGSLMVLRYSGDGFVPTIINPEPLEDVSAISFLGTEVISKHAQLQEWQVGSPADIPLETMITHEGPYSGMTNMGLESIYPIIEGYKNEFAPGFNATFSDPIGLDRIDFSLSHSVASDLPSSEDVHATLAWQHVATSQTPLSGRWNAALRHNPADFYDLFGPTKQGLKGQSASVGYEKTLIWDKPREMSLELEASHYMNLERLPSYQNIDVAFDELTAATAILSYSNVQSSLGNVDDEKGFTWQLGASANHVNGETTPKFYGGFDIGFALPIRNSSIWFRNAAGYANGEVDDEFANFYFGGFGNNYVDSGDIKRYRHAYAMPGFELNEVGGRTFYRGTAEWNLPPIRFRGIGGPRFFLSWARPALFVSTLLANVDDSALRRRVNSIGAQVDFRFTLLSRLDMTLSMGYAVGSGDGVTGSPDEFMVSLKIL